MVEELNRRTFLELGAAAAAGLALSGTSGAEAREERTRAEPAPADPGESGTARSGIVRFGIVGCGGRGRGLLGVLLGIEGVEVPAVCDVRPESAAAAQDAVEKAGRPRPVAYADSPEDFRKLAARDDLDAVLVATPWDWHARMAVAAMRGGKYAAVEVPAAITVEECWDLVNASEETGVPCMMLENWSFRRDNLAVLNMIRQGLLGEIVHCHCAHSHDCVDHWFFDPQGNIRWGGEFLVRRNADQYPTHSLGPVLSWMDINCGDAYRYLTSTATRSTAINQYFARKFGPDHPNARRRYAQGDIVTTVIKTHEGKTIVINYDMQLPRPYDNRWMIQGSLGLYDESRSAVYLEGRSPRPHEWDPFPPYQERYDHSWWKELPAAQAEKGHGGTDYLELARFVDAVRRKAQTPIDVYDSVGMSVIVALSEASIAAGSAPVECPDFTRGAWRTRRPTFAVDPAWV